MKKYICILTLLVLVFGLTTVSSAIYLKDTITDNIIEKAIDLGQNENLYEHQQEKGYIGINAMEVPYGGQGYYYNIYTPYIMIAEYSNKKAKKYMEPKRKDIEKLLDTELILVDFRLFNEDYEYNPDNIHMVIKEVGGDKVIQPTNIKVGETEYSSDYGYYSISATAYFNANTFKVENGIIDMRTLLIFISKLEESRVTVELGKIN